MKTDLAEMNEVAMRIMHMIGLAQEAKTDNEAIGSLSGMQEALHDMDVLHSYLSRRRS